MKNVLMCAAVMVAVNAMRPDSDPTGPVVPQEFFESFKRDVRSLCGNMAELVVRPQQKYFCVGTKYEVILRAEAPGFSEETFIRLTQIYKEVLRAPETDPINDLPEEEGYLLSFEGHNLIIRKAGYQRDALHEIHTDALTSPCEHPPLLTINTNSAQIHSQLILHAEQLLACVKAAHPITRDDD